MKILDNLRQRIEEWRKPPDVVPIKPTWEDRARRGINWLMVSVIVSILKMIIWLTKNRKN
jgi:hypothetical protein